MTIEPLAKLSSIPLRVVTEDLKPTCSTASSCLVRYSGKLLLLTVGHAFEHTYRWAIELHWDANKGCTALYSLNAVSFLGRLKTEDILDLKEVDGLVNTEEFLFQKMQEHPPIDFAYKLITEAIQPMHQFPDASEMNTCIPKRIIDIDIEQEPDKDTEYSFYGRTKSKIVNKQFTEWEPRLESQLKYIGKYKDFYKFKLNHDYGDSAN